MTKFNDLILLDTFNKAVESPSVSVTLESHTLSIRFDSKGRGDSQQRFERALADPL